MSNWTVNSYGTLTRTIYKRIKLDPPAIGHRREVIGTEEFTYRVEYDWYVIDSMKRKAWNAKTQRSQAGPVQVKWLKGRRDATVSIDHVRIKGMAATAGASKTGKSKSGPVRVVVTGRKQIDNIIEEGRQQG